MFLKRNRRRKDGQTYEYWSLVQTVRTAKGPRHRTVCNLGKLPGLDQQHRHGWEDLIDLLEGTEPPPKQQVLGTAHCTKNDFKCSGEKSIIRKAIVSKQAPSRRFKPHNCRTWATSRLNPGFTQPRPPPAGGRLKEAGRGFALKWGGVFGDASGLRNVA